MDALRRCSRRLQSLLLEIAEDLDKHTGNVSTAKKVGTAAAVVGTGTGIVGLIIGTILTFGAAAPLTIPAIAGLSVGFSGLGLGAAGVLTSAGASLVGKLIEKSKLTEIQESWADFQDRLSVVSSNQFRGVVSIKNLKDIISGDCLVDLTSVKQISKTEGKLDIPVDAVKTSALLHAAFLPRLSMVEFLGLLLERRGSRPAEHVRSFATVELQEINDVCEIP